MEDIALFVLPNTDEDEAGDSNASVQVAKLKSKGKSKNTESQASSLGFSEAGDHGQTPAEFAKLLTSEEAGHISKFSLWSTTEEDQTRSPQSRTSSPAIEAGSDVDRTSYLEPEDNEEEREVWIDKTGHEYAVPELLEQGIDPNSEDSSGRTPLLIAAKFNYAEDVRLLLQNGAKVDSRDPEWGLTPLSA
ncbi:hypothetical protein EDB80DRAFT_874825 [Ilyonectria destructans]|nr:hypothetical protein EDB80DRAFT_874825 [Ilyonectria destructans]